MKNISLKNKRVLISGNSGFIGGHLVDGLLNLGIGKIRFADLKTGQDIRYLTPKYYEGVDIVFHLAAQAKIQQSIDRPKWTNSHNVLGTLNVLECARKAGVKRVVYSASSSAYGEQENLPLTEDMTPNPMSPYALQKLVGEYYCKIYSSIYGLETVSLRYFNVFGENMPLNGAYSAAIPIFLDQAKNNKSLTVYGGKQSRDFTYVKDVVKANILAATSTKVGKGEVINIGSGEKTRIETLAKTISDKIEYLEYRKGEPMYTLADISKAKDLLGYSPSLNVLKWLSDLNK